MTMKEVWELLETEPTSDKRTIKHAYARAIKKYHPEEHPEQFQKIYAAFKQALEYAEYAGRVSEPDIAVFRNPQEDRDLPEKETDVPESVQEEEHTKARSEEQERIQKVFQNIRSEREKKLFIFRHKWEWYLRNQDNENVKREMVAYIETPWFTDIKEDIRLLYTLKENNRQYRELLYLLENDTKHFLYENIEKWQRMEMPSGRKNKKTKRFRTVFAICMSIAAMVLVSIPFYFVQKSADRSQTNSSMDPEQEKEEILAFLQKTYPMEKFTEIETSQETWYEDNYSEHEKYSGGKNYMVKTADSGISVHVYAVQKDGNLHIGEDFGQQYLRQLAKKRDLMCDLCHIEEPWNDGKSHYLMLGYFSMSPQLDQLERDLAEFMECFLAFAQSKEMSEFVNIEGVSFCVRNCFRPEAFLMDAGEMPKPLLYDMESLPAAKDMAEDLKYSIAEYYMHMEPWQLESDPQYEKWLNWYEKRVQERKAEPATPVGSSIVTLAREAEVEVLVYQQGVFDCISTGDMYRLFKKSGIPMTVLEGGAGFQLEDGGGYSAGTVLCERVLELLKRE